MLSELGVRVRVLKITAYIRCAPVARRSVRTGEHQIDCGKDMEDGFRKPLKTVMWQTTCNIDYQLH